MSLNKISVAQVCKLGIGFALGYLAYKFISSSSNNQLFKKGNKDKKLNEQQNKTISTQIQNQEQQNKQQLTKLKQLQQLLLHKSNDFEIQTLPQNENILTKKCLYQFFSSTYDIFDGKQITQVTLQSRKARRQILSQIQTKYQTYFRFVCTLDENIKYILEKVQRDFAIFLNLDFKKVMDSISYHVDNEEDLDKADQFRIEVVKLMSIMRENLTNYLPLFSNPITKIQLEQILTFQTQLIQNQKLKLITLIQKMGLQTKQEQQALPLFLTCYIEDKTWEKFKIQSQQMSVSYEDMDQQLRNIFEHFKNIREEIIKQMHVAIQDDIIIQS